MSTSTYATVAVPAEVFTKVVDQLDKAGYTHPVNHAHRTGNLPMDGLAITADAPGAITDTDRVNFAQWMIRSREEVAGPIIEAIEDHFGSPDTETIDLRAIVDFGIAKRKELGL